jgi:hypothetical protein
LWLLGRCSARVSDARGTQYPLAVECAASDIAGVRRTAFVQHDGRRLLIVEPERSGDGPNLDVIRRRLNWACLDDVRIVGRIPVDHRHNGKVNYPALARLLRV